MNVLSIPFYPNSEDDNRCVHACVQMILRYYFPDKDYPLSLIDSLLDYQEGKWIWKPSVALLFQTLGFEVVLIDYFDYLSFSANPDELLKKIWTREVYDIQMEHCDLEVEKLRAAEMLKADGIQVFSRPADIEDISHYLAENYSVIVTVNPFTLYNEEGYAGHSMVVLGISENEITFHDPGIPPSPNMTVSLPKFLEAFRFPSWRDAKLIAVKPR